MKNAAEKYPPQYGAVSPLTSAEWGSLDYRRLVAASLVQGAYDQEFKRQGTTARRQPPSIWCHFQIVDILKDKYDSSIFGVVYESKLSPINNPVRASTSPPRFVVALRGTIMKPGTLIRDLRVNFQFVVNRVSWSSRYIATAEALTRAIEKAGEKSVWLCGHSQGAAVALQAGKDMAKSGVFIETFLFNPPYVSLPIEKFEREWVKSGIRYAKSIFAAGINFAFKKVDQAENEAEDFKRLCSWIPHMFVNPKDPFCLEYIGYFEHKEKMTKRSLNGIDRLATEKSIIGWVTGVFGKDTESTHLIPSAFVVKNLNHVEDYRKAHTIAQWWIPLHKCESKLYQSKV